MLVDPDGELRLRQVTLDDDQRDAGIVPADDVERLVLGGDHDDAVDGLTQQVLDRVGEGLLGDRPKAHRPGEVAHLAGCVLDRLLDAVRPEQPGLRADDADG
jgi:hypothetical protein